MSASVTLNPTLETRRSSHPGILLERVVATVVTGKAGQEMADVVHPRMRQYAERCGADFFVLSGSGLKEMWPGFSKLLLGRLLHIYDRMLYVDSDILISPSAPNVFDIVPRECIGATRIDELTPAEAPAIANGWTKNDIELTQRLFGDIGWKDCYFNSGAMVMSSEHRAVFDRSFECAEEWSSRKDRIFADQSLFNYWVQKFGIPVHDLGNKFNHTPAFNQRNHRYQSHFYHYVRLRPHRRGHRLRQMRMDSWIMAHPGLHGFLSRHPRLAGLVDRV